MFGLDLAEDPSKTRRRPCGRPCAREDLAEDPRKTLAAGVLSAFLCSWCFLPTYYPFNVEQAMLASLGQDFHDSLSGLSRKDRNRVMALLNKTLNESGVSTKTSRYPCNAGPLGQRKGRPCGRPVEEGLVI